MATQVFDMWNALKKETDTSKQVPHFCERQIWFIRMGKNIGFEQSGKGDEFLCPVIILKKFNNNISWVIPLSTILKEGKYYFFIPDSAGKPAVAILSQMRLIDARRFQYRKGYVNKNIFLKLKKAICSLILSDDFL